MAGRPKKSMTGSPVSTVDTVGKLQFKVVQEANKALQQLLQIPSAIEDIKSVVSEIEASFAYSLKEHEAELAEQRQLLSQQFESYKNTIDVQQQELDEELVKKREDYERQIEKIKYEHTLAIRDMNLQVAEKIASLNNKVLLDKDLWKSKESLEKLNDDMISKISTDVKKQTETEIYQAKNAEISNLKHKYDLEIALAQRDIQSLSADIERLRNENQSLKDTIKEQNSNIVSIAESATRPTTVYETKSK